jgi:hypothetical protein
MSFRNVGNKSVNETSHTTMTTSNLGWIQLVSSEMRPTTLDEDEVLNQYNM